jgi:hypothetical protein
VCDTRNGDSFSVALLFENVINPVQPKKARNDEADCRCEARDSSAIKRNIPIAKVCVAASVLETLTIRYRHRVCLFLAVLALVTILFPPVIMLPMF